MSSISSLTKAVSGLQAAQKGLQVTAHNLSNVNTKGYTRQSLLQSDSHYLTIGNNGGYSLQVGNGVSTDEIRQIRDQLIDRRLRSDTSVLNYYKTANTTISDIETIFDEPYGDTINDMLSSFWNNIQELNTKPEGVTERTEFIAKAQVLIDKINSVVSGLEDYQDNLNKEIAASVTKVNKIIEGIRDYNLKICEAEANGVDNANDYRDTRNALIDQLAEYGDVSYYEDASGQMTVKFEGHEIVNKGIMTKIVTEPINKSTFVDLKWEDTGTSVFNLNSVVSAKNENATGSLKAMMVMRGENYVDANTTWDQLAFNKDVSVDTLGNCYVLPTIQKKLYEFTSRLAQVVNEKLDGHGIAKVNGSYVDGVPVFVPIRKPASLVEPGEHATEAEKAAYKELYNSLLVPGNVRVNPELTKEGGYNYLGTVNTTDGKVGDNSKVTDLLNAWQEKLDWYSNGTSASPDPETSSLQTFYTNVVTDFGIIGQDYNNKTVEVGATVVNITNEKLSMSGVSQDEEFSNMLKYQYAYSASARMVTMLDSMLDTIINRM